MPFAPRVPSVAAAVQLAGIGVPLAAVALPVDNESVRSASYSDLYTRKVTSLEKERLVV